MTEETPGFDEKPDVPSGATPDDAEPKAAALSEEGRRPRPGTQQQHRSPV